MADHGERMALSRTDHALGKPIQLGDDFEGEDDEVGISACNPIGASFVLITA